MLQILPPEQLNAALAAAGDLDTARYVGVLTTTETAVDAVIEHGPGRQLLVLMISVDDAGLINDLQLGLMPLRPRSEAGLAPLQLPAPTGPSKVGTDTIVTSPDGSAGRTVPVQVWYPADTVGSRDMAPYAPPANQLVLAELLAVPVEDIAQIETGAMMSPPVDRAQGKLPIVLFVPGLGAPRSYYSALASELASHGYLVAVLDHPGGANVVEYPDGAIVPARAATSELDVAAELAIRVADARSVVDLLTQLDATPGSPFGDVLDLEHIAFTGHAPVGMYAITVELVKVVCRDTESIHSSDKFALAGSIFTEDANQGVYFPTMRINDGEERVLGRSYQVTSRMPRIGVSLTGWDIDDNDSWKENEEEVKVGVKAITVAVGAIPGWGTTAAAVISGVSKAVIDAIDQFNDWDKNDKLLDYNQVLTLATGGPYADHWTDHPIVFSHSGDFLGYSSWDYTVAMRINCQWQPTLR